MTGLVGRVRFLVVVVCRVLVGLLEVVVLGVADVVVVSFVVVGSVDSVDSVDFEGVVGAVGSPVVVVVDFVLDWVVLVVLAGFGHNPSRLMTRGEGKILNRFWLYTRYKRREASAN